MTYLRLATVLLLIHAVDIAAQSTPSGRWRAVLVNPADANTVWNEVILVLNADGTTLTGTADIGHTALSRWPGLASIHNGKTDGNQFSFEWWGTPSARWRLTTFTGAVDGERMTLTMAIDDRKYELLVERLPSR